MKILVTGGHLTPAVAVIDAILAKKKDTTIYYVGQKNYLNKKKSTTLEYKEITARNIPFYNIDAGRMTRVINTRSIINFLKTPLGFIEAFFILRSIRPDKILSFGGFIAFPVSIVGALLGIPVFTHEQTINPGLANRLIAGVAKQIFVSFEEAAKSFPKSKTLLTGNPVRLSVFRVKSKPFSVLKTRPVIYITGGSLGSHSLNIIIQEILPKLLEKYTVIHQTGSVKEYGDFQKLTELKEKLPRKLSEYYFLAEHFDEDQIGYIYSIADVVIGRAGANTFFELLALKKPAILIPLPWSSGGEQEKHAQLFKSYGVGSVFYQSEKPGDLLNKIEEVLDQKEAIAKNFSLLKNIYKYDASNTIADQIFSEKN